MAALLASIPVYTSYRLLDDSENLQDIGPVADASESGINWATVNLTGFREFVLVIAGLAAVCLYLGGTLGKGERPGGMRALSSAVGGGGGKGHSEQTGGEAEAAMDEGEDRPLLGGGQEGGGDEGEDGGALAVHVRSRDDESDLEAVAVSRRQVAGGTDTRRRVHRAGSGHEEGHAEGSGDEEWTGGLVERSTAAESSAGRTDISQHGGERVGGDDGKVPSASGGEAVFGVYTDRLSRICIF